MIHTISNIVGLVTIALTLYFFGMIAWKYAHSNDRSVWTRLLNATQESATIMWSKFVIIVAGIVINVDALVDFMGVPQLKEYIDPFFDPKIVGAVIVAIMAINMRARFRTLDK